MQTLSRIFEFALNHYILSGLFLLTLGLLIFHEARRKGRSIGNGELTALVNSDQGIVLDIRAKKDFDAGHIVDSLNISHEKVVSHISELEKHKNKTIIVVDAMGQHSGTVCRDLQKAGYVAVRLGGGISTWRNANLPVVK